MYNILFTLEKCSQDFTLDAIFGNLIEELTKLATEGISVTVDSTEYKVYLVCGAFLGKTYCLRKRSNTNE